MGLSQRLARSPSDRLTPDLQDPLHDHLRDFFVRVHGVVGLVPVDQVSLVVVPADLLQIVGHDEVAVILLQKPVSHVNQFLVGHTAEEFEAIYRGLLDEVKQRLPGVPIVIMAPFVLEVPNKKHWITEDLCFKQDAVRRIAADYADVYVPLDEIFKAEFDRHEDIYYLSGDGVHPNETGHKLIAESWVNAVLK